MSPELIQQLYRDARKEEEKRQGKIVFNLHEFYVRQKMAGDVPILTNPTEGALRYDVGHVAQEEFEQAVRTRFLTHAARKGLTPHAIESAVNLKFKNSELQYAYQAALEYSQSHQDENKYHKYVQNIIEELKYTARYDKFGNLAVCAINLLKITFDTIKGKENYKAIEENAVNVLQKVKEQKAEKYNNAVLTSYQNIMQELTLIEMSQLHSANHAEQANTDVKQKLDEQLQAQTQLLIDESKAMAQANYQRAQLEETKNFINLNGNILANGLAAIGKHDLAQGVDVITHTTTTVLEGVHGIRQVHKAGGFSSAISTAGQAGAMFGSVLGVVNPYLMVISGVTSILRFLGSRKKKNDNAAFFNALHVILMEVNALRNEMHQHFHHLEKLLLNQFEKVLEKLDRLEDHDRAILAACETARHELVQSTEAVLNLIAATSRHDIELAKRKPTEYLELYGDKFPLDLPTYSYYLNQAFEIAIHEAVLEQFTGDGNPDQITINLNLRPVHENVAMLLNQLRLNSNNKDDLPTEVVNPKLFKLGVELYAFWSKHIEQSLPSNIEQKKITMMLNRVQDYHRFIKEIRQSTYLSELIQEAKINLQVILQKITELKQNQHNKIEENYAAYYDKQNEVIAKNAENFGLSYDEPVRSSGNYAYVTADRIGDYSCTKATYTKRTNAAKENIRFTKLGLDVLNDVPPSLDLSQLDLAPFAYPDARNKGVMMGFLFDARETRWLLPEALIAAMLNAGHIVYEQLNDRAFLGYDKNTCTLQPSCGDTALRVNCWHEAYIAVKYLTKCFKEGKEFTIWFISNNGDKIRIAHLLNQDFNQQVQPDLLGFAVKHCIDLCNNVNERFYATIATQLMRCPDDVISYTNQISAEETTQIKQLLRNHIAVALQQQRNEIFHQLELAWHGVIQKNISAYLHSALLVKAYFKLAYEEYAFLVDLLPTKTESLQSFLRDAVESGRCDQVFSELESLLTVFEKFSNPELALPLDNSIQLLNDISTRPALSQSTSTQLTTVAPTYADPEVVSQHDMQQYYTASEAKREMLLAAMFNVPIPSTALHDAYSTEPSLSAVSHQTQPFLTEVNNQQMICLFDAQKAQFDCHPAVIHAAKSAQITPGETIAHEEKALSSTSRTLLSLTDDADSDSNSHSEFEHDDVYYREWGPVKIDSINGAEIFIYHVYDADRNWLGSLELYGQPFLCDYQNEGQNNIHSMSGIFAQYGITANTSIGEVCQILPPSLFDKAVYHAEQAYDGAKAGVMFGGFRGLANVVAYTLRTTDGSHVSDRIKDLKAFIGGELFYFTNILALNCWSRMSNIDSLEDFIHAAKESIVKTGSTMLLNYAIRGTSQIIDTCSHYIYSQGYQRASHFLKKLGTFTRFTFYAAEAYQTGDVANAAGAFIAGAAAQTIVNDAGIWTVNKICR